MKESQCRAYGALLSQVEILCVTYCLTTAAVLVSYATGLARYPARLQSCSTYAICS